MNNGETGQLAGKLTTTDYNKCILKCEYAVRGPIPMRALELEEQLKSNPDSLPFERIVYANIGNPQQLGQKPLTLIRQVLSLIEYPPLLDLLKTSHDNELLQMFSSDAIQRAERLLEDMGGSVGAYSESQGVFGIRKTVAKYISDRDGGNACCDPADIFLTDGATSAINWLLSILCKGPETGVLIPIPQYPIYTATLTALNATAIRYYLKEENNWSTDPNQIREAIKQSIKNGVIPKVIVIINPGNPTGSILTQQSIAEILNLAAEYGLVIIADEVYQENVFTGHEFYSIRKVLMQLKESHSERYANVQLASLHSTSKGLTGECGHRGGYMELNGFTNEFKQIVLKLAAITVCSAVSGQAVMDVMVSPPKQNDDSYKQYREERQKSEFDMQHRAKKLHELFLRLEGINCQIPQGAMYLFPRLNLPKNAINKAIEDGIEADVFYCTKLLEATGICTVPGSGFGQKPGTYHLRTTFLAPGEEWIQSWEQFHENFYNFYR